MHSRLFLPIVFLGAVVLGAQQTANKSATAGQAGTSVAPLPSDPAKLSALIRASYYHPDELASLDCGVQIDWAAFSRSGKLNLPDDRLKVLQGLKVNSHAVRGNIPELTFDWSAGQLATKGQMEDGMKQMVGGFYQMYWPLLASSLVTNGADLKKVDPLADGSAKVDFSSEGTSLVITVNNDGIPTHWVLDGPAMKGTIDPEFAPTPKPISGDIRRISGVRVVQRIGESNMNVELGLDYQEVDGFFVPKSVSFGIVGAYTVPMEFSGCVTTRSASAN